MFNNKHRVYAALEGREVDRDPVSVPYVHLYYQDHFQELTGRPVSDRAKWLYSNPDQFVKDLQVMVAGAPFELLWAIHSAKSRSERENVEFISKDGKMFLHWIKENKWQAAETFDFYEAWNHVNETQFVFDEHDICERIKPMTAEQMIATGRNDYLDATVQYFGRDQFIVSGGVVGMVYECHRHVGMTHLFELMLERPELIDYLCRRSLEHKIEDIRRIAKAGGDAITIDDATATCDMISVKHYERFSLPYMKEMVREIHRLGHKAILIYFGGIADRIEQIASIGADGLIMETSMKNYVNNIDEVAEKIGKRITLFGNIDPVGVLQEGTDEELEAEMKKQMTAGKKARGFIMSTGSPVTQDTSLARVQKYLEFGKSMK